MDLIAVLTSAKKKMEKMVDDFNAALPTMKSLGLSVVDLDLNIGWLPSISVTLRGAFADMDVVRIRHLREGSGDNKVQIAILRALETAANVRNLVKGVPIDGIEVRVRLGLNFAVDVKLLTPADTVTLLPRKALIGAVSDSVPVGAV
jgi:hypothetical protein